MSDKPVMHGRDHRVGGMDPIPGFGVLPTAMVRKEGTTVVSSMSSSAITWLQSAISDSAVYSWTSGTDLNILQPGQYLAWFFIGPDSDWPASGAGYIDWFTDVSGGGNIGSNLVFPIGAHPGIDTFSPSFFTAGTSTLSLMHVGTAPCVFTGIVDNETSSSFTVAVGSLLVVVRISDALDFA